MAEREKPRRARSHMGDDDRATIGAKTRRTPPQGWPVPPHVDSELTPPPQEPPKPDTIEGFDTISPPIAKQLEILSDGLAEVTGAIGKVWDARKDSGRIDRLADTLTLVREDAARINESLREFVLPAIKSLQGTSHALWQYHERNKATVELFYGEQWPRLVKAVDDLVQRIGRVETGQDKLNDGFSSHATRLGSVENVMNAHDVRITALEQKNRDASVALEASNKTKERIFSRARLVWGALVVAVSAVGTHVVNYFRGH